MIEKYEEEKKYRLNYPIKNYFKNSIKKTQGHALLYPRTKIES